jgi:hypothetical protein
MDATCNNFPIFVRVSGLRTVTSFFQSKDLNFFLILILVIATWEAEFLQNELIG